MERYNYHRPHHSFAQWQVTWGYDTGFRSPVVDTARQMGMSSCKRGALISNELERGHNYLVGTEWLA
jgi:hypothetical protein